jgi:hypothetical protein
MGQDRKNRLDSCWDSELQIFAGHVIATVMLNDSSGSLVAPDRRTRAAGPRTVARRPAFIGVVQADSGHHNPDGDLFTPPGQESWTLAFDE